jgi:DNA processing protein
MRYSIETYSTADVAPQLLEIPHPPAHIHIAGTPPSRDTALLAVVGSRGYSPYGKEACETLIAGLAGYDITIVSGLALGIDAIAHETALLAGLKTIAVPGSGLNERVLYPRTNAPLAERIIQKGGALLSEFNHDERATQWNFPKRNRIMAGLSRAVLLIEATERSGTLITARLAADYGKDVLAVPGNIFSPQSVGTNQFISLGATPITKSSDILTAFGFTMPTSTQPSLFDPDAYTGLEREIMCALERPLSYDALCQAIKRPPHEVTIAVMKLTLAGDVVDAPTGLRRAE